MNGVSGDKDYPPSWLVENERRRLWHGPSASEHFSNTDVIEVACAGDSHDVLARVRETLDVALAQSPDNWPSPDAWLKLPPPWRVAQCRDERESEQDSLADSDFHWAVSAFVYWFLPDERQWWWNAQVQDADRLAIETAPFDLPYAWGVLEWLLYAAGALHSDSQYSFGPALPHRRGAQ
jgi:hypothetical protein